MVITARLPLADKPGVYFAEIADFDKLDNMDYNKDKVDEIALLFLTSFEEYGAMKAWKGMAWDVSDRLYEKGFIYDPKNKNKSVVFTEEGYKLCQELSEKHFELGSAETCRN
jgi:hypothetical protein